jgi:SAM-dependent methyltransferase
MSTYIFDQAWQQERDRLRALEELFDPASCRRLRDLGVRQGWRCLEVGCGAGGVALWLSDRVGSGGQVVATDLDPRFVERHGRANLDLRTHNLLTDALEEGAFDLVHARAVLEHIPERRHGLARMVSAVRPGGWLVAEDVDFGDVMAATLPRYVHPPEHAALYERVLRGVEKLFAVIGADASFGSRLPTALLEAGLEDVGAEVHAPFVRGGAERDFASLTIQHLRPQLVGAGLLSEDEVEQFLTLTAQPRFGYAPLFMVTAWGRRPGLLRPVAPGNRALPDAPGRP